MGEVDVGQVDKLKLWTSLTEFVTLGEVDYQLPEQDKDIKRTEVVPITQSHCLQTFPYIFFLT
jgi:hypothetical protein